MKKLFFFVAIIMVVSLSASAQRISYYTSTGAVLENGQIVPFTQLEQLCGGYCGALSTTCDWRTACAIQRAQNMRRAIREEREAQAQLYAEQLAAARESVYGSVVPAVPAAATVGYPAVGGTTGVGGILDINIGGKYGGLSAMIPFKIGGKSAKSAAKKARKNQIQSSIEVLKGVNE